MDDQPFLFTIRGRMPWNVQIPDAEFYQWGDPALDGLVREVVDAPLVAIDTETTGLMNWREQPLFFSLSWGERRVCMESHLLVLFQQAFRDEKKKWVFANAKFDMHMIANAGHRINGIIYDTQVMHSLLYDEMPHGLDAMGKQLLGWQWKDLFDSWDKRKCPDVGDFLLDLFGRDPQKLIEYASNDAYGTLRIYEELEKELVRTPTFSLFPEVCNTMWEYFDNIEAPFTRVLWNCERNGALIDGVMLQKISQTGQQELDQVMRDLNREAGKNVNINSPAQLQEIFFKDLKLKPIKWTKGGKSGVKKPSVDSEVLDYYRGEHPIADLILKARDIGKLIGTYANGLPKWFDNHGRIHTTFNQSVARTGRLSARDPALQTIPNTENDVHRTRAAFIAAKGMKLICCDYEALEMRLLAAAAMETDMINIFLKGWDIHMGNASMVFNLPYDDIKNAKKKAKDPNVVLSAYEHSCIKARSDVKTIGFG